MTRIFAFMLASGWDLAGDGPGLSKPEISRKVNSDGFAKKPNFGVALHPAVAAAYL
jgi:hypothetical protein